MALLYNMTVVNIKTRLNIRSGPALSHGVVGKRYNGDTFVADSANTSADGYVWYREKGTNNWSCQRTGNGQVYMNAASFEENPAPDIKEQTTPDNAADNNAVFTLDEIDTDINVDYEITDDLNGGLGGVPRQSETDELDGDYGTFQISNNRSYPIKSGGTSTYPKYNYKINTDSYDTAIQQIRENLNIPSAYDRNQVNKLTHKNFNRFRIEYPDLYIRNTIPVIIFTRPDLNFFDDDGDIDSQVSADPRTHYTILKNQTLAELLTANGYDGVTHDFNPLLSNLAQNLEISDDSVDVLETGETFSGYKMQYSKHNIKSITSGTLTIKYKETFDLAVTDMHQIWVDYQSNVYKGVFKPKRKYIWGRELDYACNIYYFLLDQDGETILFWTKYFGVFPSNVPKSTFGFDMGSAVQFPELSVTYNYIYKEDLSPVTLVEFNHNAGDEALSYEYVTSYESALGHSGRTWVGSPFVSSYEHNTGVQDKSPGFKLRWRQKRNV